MYRTQSPWRMRTKMRPAASARQAGGPSPSEPDFQNPQDTKEHQRVLVEDLAPTLKGHDSGRHRHVPPRRRGDTRTPATRGSSAQKVPLIRSSVMGIAMSWVDSKSSSDTKTGASAGPVNLRASISIAGLPMTTDWPRYPSKVTRPTAVVADHADEGAHHATVVGRGIDPQAVRIHYSDHSPIVVVEIGEPEAQLQAELPA